MEKGVGDQDIARHIPVLTKEVMAFLSPIDGKIFIDGCLGDGGYTQELLSRGARCIYSVDCDKSALVRARSFLKESQREEGKDFVLCHGFFSQRSTYPKNFPGEAGIDGVVYDLGFSSPQIENSCRGFSLRCSGPLDMRLSQHINGPTAAKAVNVLSEEGLTWVFRSYGQEKKAKMIARAITKRRQRERFQQCDDLAHVIASALGRGKKTVRRRLHPATKVFQALRILVNDELMHLAQGLVQAHGFLKKGGRLVVVSFHSLEDAIVKHFFRLCAKKEEPSLRIDVTQSLVASADEVRRNPSSRSARMRGAWKIGHLHDKVLEFLPLPLLPPLKDVQIFIRQVRRAAVCLSS